MINLVEFDVLFLKKSWKWLNDKEIKEMTDTSDFTKKDQIEWFNSLSKNKKYKIWGVMLEKKPIGACGLKKIKNKKAEYWGYIGEKNEWGKGYGKEMMNLVEKKAKEIAIKEIYLKVKENNKRAINLYIKSNFIQQDIKNNMIIMRKIIN